MHRPPLTAAEVEARITDLQDALESGTEDFAAKRRHLANTEADWKLAYHKSILKQHNEGGRSNPDVRKAIATVNAEALYRAFLTAEALVDSARDAQNSLRARLEAERTLAANVRSQT